MMMCCFMCFRLNTEVQGHCLIIFTIRGLLDILNVSFILLSTPEEKPVKVMPVYRALVKPTATSAPYVVSTWGADTWEASWIIHVLTNLCSSLSEWFGPDGSSRRLQERVYRPRHHSPLTAGEGHTPVSPATTTASRQVFQVDVFHISPSTGHVELWKKILGSIPPRFLNISEFHSW